MQSMSNAAVWNLTDDADDKVVALVWMAMLFKLLKKFRRGALWYTHETLIPPTIRSENYG